jgi:hypothetical protein
MATLFSQDKSGTQPGVVVGVKVVVVTGTQGAVINAEARLITASSADNNAGIFVKEKDPLTLNPKE